MNIYRITYITFFNIYHVFVGKYLKALSALEDGNVLILLDRPAGAVSRILQNNIHPGQFFPDVIGPGPILCFAGGLSLSDQLLNLIGVQLASAQLGFPVQHKELICIAVDDAQHRTEIIKNPDGCGQDGGFVGHRHAFSFIIKLFICRTISKT